MKLEVVEDAGGRRIRVIPNARGQNGGTTDCMDHIRDFDELSDTDKANLPGGLRLQRGTHSIDAMRHVSARVSEQEIIDPDPEC
jgi:hypothetical protein